MHANIRHIVHCVYTRTKEVHFIEMEFFFATAFFFFESSASYAEWRWLHVVVSAVTAISSLIRFYFQVLHFAVVVVCVCVRVRVSWFSARK